MRLPLDLKYCPKKNWWDKKVFTWNHLIILVIGLVLGILIASLNPDRFMGNHDYKQPIFRHNLF